MQSSPGDRLSAPGAGATGSHGEQGQQGKDMALLRAFVGSDGQF